MSYSLLIYIYICIGYKIELQHSISYHTARLFRGCHQRCLLPVWINAKSLVTLQNLMKHIFILTWYLGKRTPQDSAGTKWVSSWYYLTYMNGVCHDIKQYKSLLTIITHPRRKDRTKLTRSQMFLSQVCPWNAVGGSPRTRNSWVRVLGPVSQLGDRNESAGRLGVGYCMDILVLLNM